MSAIFLAFMRALRDLWRPRILVVMLLPMTGAIAVWAVLAWIFWGDWTSWLGMLAGGTALARWFDSIGAGWLMQSIAALGAIVLLVPAAFITAALITELIAMPVIVKTVARADYSNLERRQGGSVAGSMLNAAAGIVLFCLLWIVTLPLWFTGFAALLLPAPIAAYLNQRLFRYDALAEHASREEYRALVQANRGRLYLLGLLLATLYYVPVVNLAAPVITGLAYTHFCLGALARLRGSGRG
jgi:CysZ protein